MLSIIASDICQVVCPGSFTCYIHFDHPGDTAILLRRVPGFKLRETTGSAEGYADFIILDIDFHAATHSDALSVGNAADLIDTFDYTQPYSIANHDHHLHPDSNPFVYTDEITDPPIHFHPVPFTDKNTHSVTDTNADSFTDTNAHPFAYLHPGTSDGNVYTAAHIYQYTFPNCYSSASN